MPTLPNMSGTTLARREEWDAMNSSAQDVLFNVAGVVLAVATLGVAYVHYRHRRGSERDGEEVPVDASVHSMS